jgi:KaiC/GvpD/RAD55 family RecA-like ATPase
VENSVSINKLNGNGLVEVIIKEVEHFKPMSDDFAELANWLKELEVVRDSFGRLLLKCRGFERVCDDLQYIDRDLELLLYETGMAGRLKNVRLCSHLIAKALSKALKTSEGQALEEPRIMPLRRLIEEAKPLEYICKPLVPRRSLVLLAGKAGAGKSLLCLHLAHAVASSTKVFDRFEVVENTRVLIIDEENAPSTYRERVGAMGLNPLDGIDCLSLAGFKLDNPGHLKFLERAIESIGYGLVILDNWTDLVHRVDENNAIEVSNILSALRRIAYERDCTFILVHHLRKNLPFLANEIDELRGSSALANEADLVYLVQVDEATGHRIVKAIKNRHGERLAFRLAFETKDGRLAIKWAGEVEENEVESDVVNCARAVMNYVKSVGRARRSEIVEAMKRLGYSRSTIDRALLYASSLTGQLKRVARGLYEPKSPPTHSEEVK